MDWGRIVLQLFPRRYFVGVLPNLLRHLAPHLSKATGRCGRGSSVSIRQKEYSFPHCMCSHPRRPKQSWKAISSISNFFTSIWEAKNNIFFCLKSILLHHPLYLDNNRALYHIENYSTYTCEAKRPPNAGTKRFRKKTQCSPKKPFKLTFCTS